MFPLLSSPFSTEKEGKPFSLGRSSMYLRDAEFSEVQLEQASAQPGHHQGCCGFDGTPSSQRRVSKACIWPDVLADRTGHESSEDMEVKISPPLHCLLGWGKMSPHSAVLCCLFSLMPCPKPQPGYKTEPREGFQAFSSVALFGKPGRA